MSAAKSKPASGLRIRQVRSGIGFDKTQKATLKALGLGRVGKSRLVPDNREVRGMLFKVTHLVSWSEEGDAGKGSEA
jgi:large subunit ribosomal protein L30